MLKPGRVAIGRKGDADVTYILKHLLMGGESPDEGEGRFSVTYRFADGFALSDAILDVKGDILSEKYIASSGKTETIDHKVKWLNEAELKELRIKEPGIDGYIRLLEEGKPANWYFGG